MDVFKVLADLRKQRQLIDEVIIAFERLAVGREPERSVSAPAKKKAVLMRAAVERATPEQAAAKGE